MKKIVFILIALYPNYLLCQQRDVFFDMEIDSNLESAIESFFNFEKTDSYYIEYGYLFINTQEANSHYVEKKISEGRFFLDTLESSINTEMIKSISNFKIISIYDFFNASNFHLKSNEHYLNYITFKGKVVLFLNFSGNFSRNYIMKTDYFELNEFLTELLFSIKKDIISKNLIPN